MDRDPVELLLARQAVAEGGASQFDRDRLPTAAALVFLGVALVVVVMLCAMNDIISSVAVVGGFWVLGGVLFWSGVFFPFHLGWVGVLIGLILTPVLFLLFVASLASHA